LITSLLITEDDS